MRVVGEEVAVAALRECALAWSTYPVLRCTRGRMVRLLLRLEKLLVTKRLSALGVPWSLMLK